MSDPTKYHRKLAEAIWSLAWDESHKRGSAGIRLEDIAAALASDGVVEPGHYTKAYYAVEKDLAESRAEVERLKAAHANAVELLHEANLAGTTVTGMEQAAKLLHDQGYFKSAAAIRAEIKQCSPP